MSDASTLLAATDFSDPARHAADRAARIAEESGALLTLMHVLPGGALDQLRLWLGDGHAGEQRLHDDTRQRLQALAESLRAARPIEVRTVHTIGSAVDDVLIEASTLEAWLVVVAGRGARSLRHRVLGSTAERLLRRTLRPVLVVSAPAQASYRRMLLALDFSAWSIRAVAIARQVAPRARPVLFHAVQIPFQGRLHLAGVEEATVEAYRGRALREGRERLAEFARTAGLADGAWDACVVDGEASDAIVEQAQEQGCDLIVLGKHGASVTEDLILGSVTRHVLAEGTIDVLVSTRKEP